MAKEIRVITATRVEDTGEISFSFMFASGAPRGLFMEHGGIFGLLSCKGEWNVFLGSNGRQVFSGNGEEMPPNEDDLKKLLLEMSDCVLLMERGIFDRFHQACRDINMHVESFHYEGTLHTS